MSVAKQRHTRARRDRARIHHKIKPKKSVFCSNCKTEIMPHIVCTKCGYYKGKEVIDTAKKIRNKNKK